MSTYTNKTSGNIAQKISTKDLMRTSALTAAGLLAFSMTANAMNRNTPLDGTVVEGAATTSAVANGYLTNQTTGRALTVYQKSLLIKEGETWTINQLNANSVSAHKVLTKDAYNSIIRGNINTNGNFILIDPNGILVTSTGSIDANGVLLTTGNITNEQIVTNPFGQYEITDITDGTINLKGQINVAQAGLAAFVAPTVKNSGIINANLSKVAFASGEKSRWIYMAINSSKSKSKAVLAMLSCKIPAQSMPKAV